MAKKPFALYLFSISAVLLALWMSIDGLYARLFGAFPSLFGMEELWMLIPNALNLDPMMLAWPLVVLGISWLGAVMGTWMAFRWAYRLSCIYGFISLAYLGPGTVLGMAILAFLWMPSTRNWLEEEPGAQDGGE